MRKWREREAKRERREDSRRTVKRKMKRKTRGRKIAGSQRGRRRSTRGGIVKERVGKSKRRYSEKKEGRREKGRDEGPKETRVPECLFEFLAKWPSVRSAAPVPTIRAGQPASRSQTKSHGFTYYDLHPCPLPLLLFLLSSRLLRTASSVAVTAAAALLPRDATSRSLLSLLRVSFEHPPFHPSLLLQTRKMPMY